MLVSSTEIICGTNCSCYVLHVRVVVEYKKTVGTNVSIESTVSAT